MNSRVGVLLAALAGLPGALRAAEPPGPIARSVERAVAALDAPAPDRARPSLCVTGCASLEPAQEKSDRPYMSGALASGVGLAVGLSAGLGLGKPDEGAGLPALRGGWQTGSTPSSRERRSPPGSRPGCSTTRPKRSWAAAGPTATAAGTR